MTLPNLLGHAMSPIYTNRHWPTLKRLFIRARPEGLFYENLVRIVLIISLELDIMKKPLTARESTYIKLIFHKKINVLV